MSNKTRPQLTQQIAFAAAQDVAQRLMRKAGRKVWSEDDYNAAVREYERLWPEEAS